MLDVVLSQLERLELGAGRMSVAPEESPLVHEARADDVEGGGEEAGGEGGGERGGRVAPHVVAHRAVPDQRSARVVVRRELREPNG